MMVDFSSLVCADGRIVLSFAANRERDAFFAASMIIDVLAQKVRLAATPGPPALLRVHIGDTADFVFENTTHSDRCLVVRRPVSQSDTTVTFESSPWSACSPVLIPGLGWAEGNPGETVLPSDRGAILSRDGGIWCLNADLPGVFGREVLRHDRANGNIPALLASILVLRAALVRMGLLPDGADRATSLITVDAEDQQRYFMNRYGKCSNIRGAPSDDLLFAKSCRTIMDRCESFGAKAVFMVTGDELDPSFRDAFGDQLVGLEDNRRVLNEIVQRGHDIACHGFDHEWWVARGYAANQPMTLAQKIAYFARTSGDLRTLFGLIRFVLRHARLLHYARAAKRRREQARNTPFTYTEMRQDIERWIALVGFNAKQFLIRYPGYVRSAATLEFLDDRFAATVDSSDLYDLAANLPAYPYRLLMERNGCLRRTRVTEIPCIWIDELLRTRSAQHIEADLSRLRGLAAFPGSVLSLVTHTKVLGADYDHCHLYLHDPLRGMALPIVESAWQQFGEFLASRTRSCNWRDLQAILVVPE